VNLNAIVGPIVTAVNPRVPCTISLSTGYTTLPDSSRVPTYALFLSVLCQIQALTYGDLRQVDGMNLNGTRRAIYINGEWNGVVRPLVKGGDLVTFPNGEVWLVALALESWRGWTKTACTLQNGS
jgi:hypothetical protein